jgi:hypothetical protein
MVEHLAELLDFVLAREETCHECNHAALEDGRLLETDHVDADLSLMDLADVRFVDHGFEPFMLSHFHDCRSLLEVLDEALFQEVGAHRAILVEFAEASVVRLVVESLTVDVLLLFACERGLVAQHHVSHNS